MKAKVYNLKNEAVGEIDLPEKIFNRKWNADLVHQAVVAQAANRRRPWAHVKNRGEVSGGGRKPWRQKHTGRARHGSIRSPLWKGGGVTHGPLKERVFAQILPKKMRRAAIAAALSKKLADQNLKIIDSLELPSHKTKELTKYGITQVLLVPTGKNKNIYLASRNIPKVKALNPKSLNIEDLLKYRDIFIDQNAIKEF
jgi:large subunit ribosomal protein L4